MKTLIAILALTMASTTALGQTPDPARDLINYWHEAGPVLWFGKDAAWDKRFRERYASLYESAKRGELSSWQRTPDGALALVLLLDQYPRNSFRGTPQMYATDAQARKVADAAIAKGYDRKAPQDLQVFFVLPFAHSENLADQDRSVEMAKRLTPVDLAHAEQHRDIVKRFGRFPHRNKILGRTMTAEEQEYLDHGGFAG